MGQCQSAYQSACVSIKPDISGSIRLLGQYAELAEKRAPGLLLDNFGNPWDINHAKDNVYDPIQDIGQSAKAPVWTSRDGAQISHPHGVHLVSPAANSQYFNVGLLDSRTRTLDASTSFQLTIGKDGALTPEASAHIRELRGSGKGQMAYEFYLPCASLTRAGKVEPKEYDWVREVVLGAQVRGMVNFHNFDPELVWDAKAKVGADLGPSGLKVDGEAGVHSHTAGKYLTNNMTQEGGIHLITHKHESKNLVELYKYLQDSWAKSTRKRAETWQPLMVKVEKKVDVKSLEESPHVVVVGQSKAGKSSFLNTFSGGIKDGGGRPVFPTAKREDPPANTQVQSEVRRLDAFTRNYLDDRAVEVKKPFRLTDVPGFGSGSIKDDEIYVDLLQHLRDPKWCSVHAVIWVTEYEKCRITEDDRKVLITLEEHFGKRFWDLLVVVFTNFKYGDPKMMPAKEDAKFINKFTADMDSKNTKLADRIADELKQYKASNFLDTLKELHRAAGDRYGENRNMFYLIDNEDAQLSKQALDELEEAEKTRKEGDPDKGEFYRRQGGQQYAKDEMRRLKMHMLAATKSDAEHRMDDERRRAQDPLDVLRRAEESEERAKLLQSLSRRRASSNASTSAASSVVSEGGQSTLNDYNAAGALGSPPKGRPDNVGASLSPHKVRGQSASSDLEATGELGSRSQQQVDTADVAPSARSEGDQCAASGGIGRTTPDSETLLGGQLHRRTERSPPPVTTQPPEVQTAGRKENADSAETWHQTGFEKRDSTPPERSDVNRA